MKKRKDFSKKLSVEKYLKRKKMEANKEEIQTFLWHSLSTVDSLDRIPVTPYFM